MSEPKAPPAPAPAPAPGWDCHVHVFDAARPALQGHYRPADHPLQDIEALAATAGVGHLVLVQPSVYGADHSLMAEALARRPGRHRGVIHADASLLAADLAPLHALGVRGVRLNRVSPVGHAHGPAPLWHALAPRLSAQGWHVQWYATPAQLPAIAALHALRGAPVAVIDHLGSLHDAVPANDPAWAAMRTLAEHGAWLKLSGWYRLGAPGAAPEASPKTPCWAAHEVALARLAGWFSQRIVWGSDWPHTGQQTAPTYDAVWAPVRQLLGAARAAAVRGEQAMRLYG